MINIANEEHNEIFVSWLHNAHAMEVELVEVLKAHADQAEAYPDVAAKISEHLEQTKNHAQIVKNILEELGEDTSTVKSTMGSIAGKVAGASTAMADDNLVKNAIAEFASENMEIASYSALVQAAKHFGHDELIEPLNTILAEEREMAKWLEENLPTAVQTVLEE